MSWLDSSHLALDLIGLGRAFFLLPPATAPREPFNPALGKTVNLMMERAIACAARNEWYEAEKWCVAGEETQNLEAVYRGVMHPELAHATARYFHCVVFVGMRHWVEAIGGLTQVAETLSFKLPDHSAAVWLALGQVYCYHFDASHALWALQRGVGLVQGRDSVASQKLQLLLDAEYARVVARCQI